ncbi:MAG: hypothetical protein CXZ00_12585 [Acidobacteria bacterium]|nr:MAG: hypothetical protein CXZ00_12585 [Acidobacteriota bacterium]
MNAVRMVLCFVAGFALCLLLLHPRAVKAANSVVRVRRVQTGAMMNETNVGGEKIVGFSCAAVGDGVHCFIASE